MRAINCIRENEIIENAVVLKARWGDDTFSFYVVAESEAEAQLAAWRDYGADAEYAPEVTVENQDNKWVGMKVAGIGCVAAWGHARLEH